MTKPEGLTSKQDMLQMAKKPYSKSFTTKPKLRRIVWHKQQTVRNRAYALQESFYPTTDVRYKAVRQRMATLLGLVDDQTVLAYLGRPEYMQKSVMEQTVRYVKSGATVPKKHYFKRKLPAKKGYIEIFGLGYVYIKNDEWWIHWNHTTQLTLPESEGLKPHQVSKVDFSLL